MVAIHLVCVQAADSSNETVSPLPSSIATNSPGVTERRQSIPSTSVSSVSCSDYVVINCVSTMTNCLHVIKLSYTLTHTCYSHMLLTHATYTHYPHTLLTHTTHTHYSHTLLTCASIHTRAHTRMHTHTCIHTYIHTHAYTHMHTHTCIHTHTYIHMHTHTCIHTHTYTHMPLHYTHTNSGNGISAHQVLKIFVEFKNAIHQV